MDSCTDFEVTCDLSSVYEKGGGEAKKESHEGGGGGGGHTGISYNNKKKLRIGYQCISLKSKSDKISQPCLRISPCIISWIYAFVVFGYY
jgi:hypothetical protein